MSLASRTSKSHARLANVRRLITPGCDRAPVFRFSAARMLLRRWAEQQQQKPWYWWWWQGLCTAQCLLTQLNECTNKMAKATLVSPFFDLYNNAWVNAISCIQLAGQSTTLHGKHFNVGHYTKTVKSNVCRLAMSTGAIDIRHFIPLPVSWDLLQDHVEFLSSEKQERAFLFWFVWYSQ